MSYFEWPNNVTVCLEFSKLGQVESRSGYDLSNDLKPTGIIKVNSKQERNLLKEDWSCGIKSADSGSYHSI